MENADDKACTARPHKGRVNDNTYLVAAVEGVMLTYVAHEQLPQCSHVGSCCLGCFLLGALTRVLKVLAGLALIIQPAIQAHG